VQRDEEEAPRRGRQRSQSPNSILLPAAVLMGLIVGAILLARAVATREAPQAAPSNEPAQPEPFSKYTEEPPSVSGRPGGGPAVPRAPSGLAASNPDWAEALTIAAAADELFAEANKAKLAEDHATFALKGKAAKETYDKAIILTAAWEEEILDKYGERDPQVREIMRIRSSWIDRLRVLHKSTGR
jgi:hypothetical protein